MMNASVFQPDPLVTVTPLSAFSWSSVVMPPA
jgi:hypothetical protein